MNKQINKRKNKYCIILKHTYAKPHSLHKPRSWHRLRQQRFGNLSRGLTTPPPPLPQWRVATEVQTTLISCSFSGVGAPLAFGVSVAFAVAGFREAWFFLLGIAVECFGFWLFGVTMGWCGLIWTGVDWHRLTWTDVDWCGMAWTDVDWRGLTWIDVDWRGLTWIILA